MTTFNADKIKNRRLRLGLTQQQLAKAAGITREHLSVIESGKSNPRTSTLLAIAKALRCRVSYFFTVNRKKVGGEYEHRHQN